jgi:hypothetical protein
MLASLLGSVNKERVLVYLAARGRGYSREIARFFKSPLYPVQNALDKLEAAGVLVSRPVGSTREYEFNPRYPARPELTSLVDRALALYPTALKDALLLTRTRPRRRGKPPALTQISGFVADARASRAQPAESARPASTHAYRRRRRLRQAAPVPS